MTTKFSRVAHQIADELGIARAGAADALRRALGQHAPEVDLSGPAAEVALHQAPPEVDAADAGAAAE